MALTITAAIARIKSDVGRWLTADAIRSVSRDCGHSWRERLLDPVTTVHLFVLQILHGNTACSHVPRLGGVKCTGEATGRGGGADQFSGLGPVAGRGGPQRHPAPITHQPTPPEPRGTPRREAATQELPVTHSPAKGITKTPEKQGESGLTLCHSNLSPFPFCPRVVLHSRRRKICVAH
jgi:hypothetical protein